MCRNPCGHPVFAIPKMSASNEDKFHMQGSSLQLMSSFLAYALVASSCTTDCTTDMQTATSIQAA